MQSRIINSSKIQRRIYDERMKVHRNALIQVIANRVELELMDRADGFITTKDCYDLARAIVYDSKIFISDVLPLI